MHCLGSYPLPYCANACKSAACRHVVNIIFLGIEFRKQLAVHTVDDMHLWYTGNGKLACVMYHGLHVYICRCLYRSFEYCARIKHDRLNMAQHGSYYLATSDGD